MLAEWIAEQSGNLAQDININSLLPFYFLGTLQRTRYKI